MSSVTCDALSLQAFAIFVLSSDQSNMLQSEYSELSSGEECIFAASAGPSAPKKSKKEKKKKYRCKYKKDWEKKWPFILSVGHDSYSVRCNMCASTFSCAYQGEKDISRHVLTENHKRNVAARSTLSKLPFLAATARVTRAEVKVAAMLVRNNIPLSLADELTPLFQDIFSDSDIAAKYSSRRTKTMCIVNGAIAPHFKENFVASMKESPFSACIDGSSDDSMQKMNPLTIRIFDVNRGQVATQFLDMCMASSSTAEGTFTKMNEVLETNSVTWDNCVGFGLDNTSVNMGCRNCIKTCIHAKNEAVYIMGCPCHIVHNTAGKAADAYESMTGFNVDDLVIDVFYWFDKSTKRKSNLSDHCDFCNTTYRDIVKHVNTRWLSLERAVGRVLQQYAELKSYFASEHDTNPRFLRLQKLLADPMTEVYLYFYQATLQTFVHFNQFSQREDPIISLVDQQIQSFLTKLAGKFLTINTIKAAKSDLTKLKFDTSVQLPDGSIFVGMTTKTQLTKLFAEGDITHAQYSKFFKGEGILCESYGVCSFESANE